MPRLVPPARAACVQLLGSRCIPRGATSSSPIDAARFVCCVSQAPQDKMLYPTTHEEEEAQIQRAIALSIQTAGTANSVEAAIDEPAADETATATQVSARDRCWTVAATQWLLHGVGVIWRALRGMACIERAACRRASGATPMHPSARPVPLTSVAVDATARRSRITRALSAPCRTRSALITALTTALTTRRDHEGRFGRCLTILWTVAHTVGVPSTAKSLPRVRVAACALASASCRRATCSATA